MISLAVCVIRELNIVQHDNGTVGPLQQRLHQPYQDVHVPFFCLSTATAYLPSCTVLALLCSGSTRAFDGGQTCLCTLPPWLVSAGQHPLFMPFVVPNDECTRDGNEHGDA